MCREGEGLLEGAPYSLVVELGEGRASRAFSLKFSLRDLREGLPQAEMDATMQCTYGRRGANPARMPQRR